MVENEQPTMIHVRRGGSGDDPKDKDARFVPVHPRIAELLRLPRQRSRLVFRTI